MKVFKYPVGVADYIHVDLPAGAKPLHFAMQGDQLCLWALVDHAKPMGMRAFRMAGTGQVVEKCGQYVNTVFIAEGQLVFHFFAMDE